MTNTANASKLLYLLDDLQSYCVAQPGFQYSHGMQRYVDQLVELGFMQPVDLKFDTVVGFTITQAGKDALAKVDIAAVALFAEIVKEVQV